MTSGETMVRVFGFWLQMGPKDEKYAAGCWANLISLGSPLAHAASSSECKRTPSRHHSILLDTLYWCIIFCAFQKSSARPPRQKKRTHVNILPPDVITE
jgi:hypothetical protein